MNSFRTLGATVCDILYFLQLFLFSECFPSFYVKLIKHNKLTNESKYMLINAKFVASLLNLDCIRPKDVLMDLSQLILAMKSTFDK